MTTRSPRPGRLLLVAPNIAEVERRLDVPTRDFRLWVCLHEQTHRVQFTAVPWLRDHLESELAAFADVTDLDPNAVAARLRAGADTPSAAAKGGSIVELLQTPEQRVVLDRLQAIMTLLEGHADQVMDAVGPVVVPSVKTIRERFERRRDGISPIDRVVRQLLGSGPEAAAVPAGRRVRARGRLPGRRQRLQHRLGVAPDPADAAPSWRHPRPGSPGSSASPRPPDTGAMAGPPPAVAAVRLAVRRALADLPAGSHVLVAGSGGPDSTALAAATAFVAPRLGLTAGFACADQQWSADSAGPRQRGR